MRTLHLFLLWLCCAGTVLAQDTVATNAVSGGATNRTVITSDHLEFDYPRSTAIFTGHVVVEDKDIRMWADQMTVILSPTDDIQSIVAVGSVRIMQGDREARCRKAIFLVTKHEVILTGDAVIRRGRDRVKGNIITIWTDSDRMVSEPGHLVLHPGDGA